MQLPPNRALPRFVAAETADRGRVARFDLAHHHGAFFGIVADRIADAQVVPTTALRAFRDSLRGAWVTCLVDAVGDERLARDAAAADLRAWHVGLLAERAAFTSKRLTFEGYPAMVIPRLRWISTAARLMVSRDQGPAAEAALRRTCDLFLFACQLRDDAIDEAEDRRARGASVPDLLGVPSGAMLRAAYLLVREASDAAFDRFPSLARWLRSFAAEANVGISGQHPAACGLLGAALADAALEAT